MADIRLNVTGDSSGGVAAVDGMADAVGKSNVKWQEMANVAKLAAKAVVDFVTTSIAKYAEAERVQKQLTRVAGEYTDALTDQAEALAALYSVDDDIIKQSEILMTQWGGVGAATRATEQAILDYAAATGQDAVAATQDLIRNVESGGVGLAKMGVHFEATGDKGRDLANAVDALSKKFGGAAGANAGSLSGQVSGLSIAFEDLQEDIGGAISSMAAQLGVVSSLTEAVRGLRTMAFGDKSQDSREERLHIEEQLTARLEHRKVVVRELQEATDSGDKKAADAAARRYTENERGIQMLKQWRDEANAANASDISVNTVTGKTNKAMKEDAKDAKGVVTEGYKAFQEETSEHVDQMALYSAELQKQAEDESKAILEAEAARLDEARQMRAESRKTEEEMAAESYRKMRKMEDAAFADAEDKRRSQAKRQADQSRRVGDAVGAAFVNALSDRLDQLAEGGEFDVAQFVGDILAATFAIAATAIGSAYGMPELGGAIGNFGAMGIRAGAKEVSRANRTSARAANTSTFHDGGWVGAPRHHSGSWIGSDEERAILQTGERVLSRREVGSMGGPGAVDKMAKGGGSRIVVNVSALDAKSAAESFETEVGKGLRRAVRSGRGDVPSLFGMGPR